MDESKEGRFRWTRWTPSRGGIAVVWLAATAAAAVAMLLPIPVATATLFGDPPTVGNFRDAALFSLLAGVVGAAGPFGIWLVRRSGAWRAAALAIFVLLSCVAAYYFTKAQDAPRDRPIGSIALGDSCAA